MAQTAFWVRRLLPVGVTGAGGFVSGERWSKWREDELARLGAKAEALAAFGYVAVQASPSEKKVKAWQAYLPALIRTWERASPSFELKRPSSWPVSPTGRAHAFTHIPNDSSQHFPIKVWGHYEAQAVVCALVDPSLKGVHFGSKTHWKLRLLRGTPFCLSNEKTLCLTGEPNGWGISVFPTPGKSKGTPTPKHAHVDGGRNGVLDTCGVGCLDDLRSDANGRRDELYRLLALQLSIAIYCCTPGDLTPERGSTGVYLASHLIVLAALRARKPPTPWPDLKHALSTEPAILKGLLTQTTIPDDSMLLFLGPVVHGTMFANQPMPQQLPRVIMNAKCFVNAEDDDFFSREAGLKLRQIVESSAVLRRHQEGDNTATYYKDPPPLSDCLSNPRTLWRIATGLDETDFDKRVDKLLEALVMTGRRHRNTSSLSSATRSNESDTTRRDHKTSQHTTTATQR